MQFEVRAGTIYCGILIVGRYLSWFTTPTGKRYNTYFDQTTVYKVKQYKRLSLRRIK